MFKSMQGFFDNRGRSGPQDEARRLQVATCALLLEAAQADRDFSAQERDKIAGIVAARFGLAAADATELLDLAERERSGSDDLYQFARLINDHFTHPRKLAIAELLWEVVYSDDVLAAQEDALMHKLGTILGLRHQELMALKVKVKNSRR